MSLTLYRAGCGHFFTFSDGIENPPCPICHKLRAAETLLAEEQGSYKELLKNSEENAIRIMMERERWRGTLNQLCDDVLRAFVEYGYATPEKTYRDNPYLLISDLRAIIGSLRHALVNGTPEGKESQNLNVLKAALEIYANKENWNQKDMRTGAFDWFMRGNAGWDIAESALKNNKP
jgi:hypothetical protein